MAEMDFYILTHKSLTGQLSSLEQRQLDTWLLQDVKNQQAYQEIKRIWELDIDDDETDHVSEAHFQEELRILESAVGEAKRKEDLIKRYKRYAAFGLVTTVICIFLFAWELFLLSEKLPTDTVKFASLQNSAVWLADSSQVFLNDSSFFSYRAGKQTRLAELSGEALFQINPEKRPFVVSANGVQLEVLGTSFVVKAYPGKDMEIIVISGTVSVRSQKQSVTLSTGEKASIKGEQIQKQQNLDPNFDAWYTGKLEFKNTELGEVLKLISQQYDATFAATDSNVLRCRFTGKFNDSRLEDVLRALSFSMNIVFVPGPEGRYIISGAGCMK
ncbi:FecR family protein [Chryseolinea lacunae]|uniref:DUF4974 domain-containing protein n=1 Tax=Chryseolinea lacunae TaxID=2801331 RepID=A0ABS1L303_9BACT|nr:FecR domain-containing protein [Chryseolinea lacunae]MBL0745813.1 DUF4974 domain-containing protein [Chryseolinea lacunae]